MKAMNCLLVSLCAGACTTAVLAQGQDDVTKFIQPHKVDRVRMVGQIGGSGFGTRAATQVDYYSNVDLGGGSWIFYGGGVNNTGDHLVFEKGGYNALGNAIYPVASPAKVGTVEFWVIASDLSSATGAPVDCTVTLEMFDHLIDWSPVATTAIPNTCHTSGDDAVNQVSLGGFYIDLTGGFAPINGYANGYILDTGGAGLAWTMSDGNGFLDERVWAYNGGSPPVALSTTCYCTYDGSNGNCAYPDGSYPALGYSADNFYLDANGDGRYSRNERYYYGGLNFLSNLMVRLGGDDGCSFDIDGDGFVSGNDTDYALELIAAGCPY